jgi:hypothetical protein
MFDLLLGLRQAVKGGAQVEVDIKGSQPLFRYFWVLGLCIFGFWAFGLRYSSICP